MNKALEKLKKQQLERKEAMDKLADRAAMRARIELQMEQKRLADIEEKRLREEHEAEEKIRLAEEKRIADIEAKTHKYYEINQYGRKKNVDGLPMYYGETVRVHPEKVKDSAWAPHGFGEFHYDGSIECEGQYVNGKLFGEGKYNFQESNYFGAFKEGNMHGDGVMVTPKGREIVLMRNNIKICSKDGKCLIQSYVDVMVCRSFSNLASNFIELLEGKQIEFDDPSLKLYSNGASNSDTLHFKDNSKGIKSYIKGSPQKAASTVASTGMEVLAYQMQSLCPSNGSNKIKGCIMRHIYDWRYLIRFDNEVYPRQREIDLSRIKYFKVLHHMPMVIHLDNYTNRLGGAATLRNNLDDDFSLADKMEDMNAALAEEDESGSEASSRSASTLSSPRKPQKSGLRYSAHPKARQHITNYNTNRNYNSNSKTDSGISYDYYADTFGVVTKPNIKENILFGTLTNEDINNRDNANGKSAAGAVVIDDAMEEEPNDSMEQLISVLARAQAGGFVDGVDNKIDPKVAECQRIQSMDGAYRRTLARHIVGSHPLPTKGRYTSDGRENVFESRAVGIGAAEEEEQARLRAELKKKQWQALIDDRKKEQEAARQKKIEEEQKAMLEQSLQDQQKISQQKKDEADAFKAAVGAAKEEEQKRWEKK